MTKPEPKSYISAIHAYTPGKAKADDGRVLVKLSANENPLGCSADASSALAAQAGNVARYPDPASHALRAALADTYGLEADQIVCGTGSDELLNLVAAGYAGVGDEIIHVNYGFMVYEIATRKVGAEVVMAPDHDYGTDVDGLLALVTPKTRVVYLANPNNPTGTITPDSEIERLHAGLPQDVVLVLDQAYGEYLDNDGAASFDLARRHGNVLITRTFPKSTDLLQSALAGPTDSLILSIHLTGSAGRLMSRVPGRPRRSRLWRTSNLSPTAASIMPNGVNG